MKSTNEASTMEKKILEKARGDEGTWSFAFLQECQAQFQKFRIKDLNEIGNALIDSLCVVNDQPLVLFKLSQFLSLMKNWNLPQIEDIFVHRKNDIQFVIEKTDSKPLSQAAKRLLTFIISNNESSRPQPVQKVQYKAFSTPPIESNFSFHPMNNPQIDRYSSIDIYDKHNDPPAPLPSGASYKHYKE